ncbi:HicB [hydrothermal vent metagenome]|uniref:HicB n=1 Tax=hydrothermal vent metagenome TaxID=652676 RepID=A0A3B0Z4T7_9ZZZZ
MAHDKDKYAYRVLWSEEDQEYVGLCSELSSLSWLAITQEKALKGIKKLVAECVSDLEDNGEAVPQAISVRNYSGKFMVRIPPEIHRQLALQAAEAGVSLNRVASAKLAH